MKSTGALSPAKIAPLLERAADDPWSLGLAERRSLLRSLDGRHTAWLARLPALVEPPAPGPGFPAFLLDMPRFEPLRRAIGDAERRVELDTATADELQRFVDLFRDYAHVEEPAEELIEARAPTAR